jgi:hypothetical protein
LSSIKDLSKWQRQIYLKKISPNAFLNLHTNVSSIKNIFDKIGNDKHINEYLYVFEKNTNKIKKIEQYI